MLEIGLVPKSSGSTGFGRFYPHEGYLGLSPVVVSGTIVSHLPPLCPTLPIRQVTISLRCIETRTIGTEVEGVLWERAKRLWEPSGESEYEELGDWSSPFQITVPKDAVAASAQWTRDLKVIWQLQVSFEHKPIPYVGNRIVKTYLVDIQSYASHPLPPPSPPSAIHLQGAEVFVNPPHGQFGPGETFTLSLHVKPEDPTTSIRRTTLILERHTISHGGGGGGRRSHSPGYTKLEEPHVTKILETTTDEAAPGSGGTYWVSISATVPKRGGRWQAGETGTTKLTSTTFECRLKISLKVKKSSKEMITSIPIVLVACTSSERSSAQAIIKEAESHPKAALPRRKHRSSRRGLYMHEGTVDISDPIVHGRTRRRHKTTPVSPILAVSPTHTEGVKPILLSSPVPQPQSISFAPSLPITTLIHPPTPSTPSAPAFSPFDQPPDEYPDASLRRQYQSTGRRISTTTSEEEEIQPSRNRMRLDDLMFPMPPSTLPQSQSQTNTNTYRDDPPRDRPSLPSLDVLGLGLPPVPEYDRPPTRPRTAPAHSCFPILGSRPGSSAGVPPPLSGNLAMSPQKGLGMRPVTSGYGREKREDEGAFAFGLARR